MTQSASQLTHHLLVGLDRGHLEHGKERPAAATKTVLVARLELGAGLVKATLETLFVRHLHGQHAQHATDPGANSQRSANNQNNGIALHNHTIRTSIPTRQRHSPENAGKTTAGNCTHVAQLHGHLLVQLLLRILSELHSPHAKHSAIQQQQPQQQQHQKPSDHATTHPCQATAALAGADTAPNDAQQLPKTANGVHAPGHTWHTWVCDIGIHPFWGFWRWFQGGQAQAGADSTRWPRTGDDWSTWADRDFVRPFIRQP